jgi:hypothetical protein
MSDPLKTVRDLIAKALNDGATLDEQRNSALAAVRLIAKHKMHVTNRPPIPVVDVPPQDILRHARETAAEGIVEIAERFAKDGLAGVVDLFGDENGGREVKSHTRVKATRRNRCDNCSGEIRPGDVVVVELTQPKMGRKRVTCIRDKCVSSWTGL